MDVDLIDLSNDSFGASCCNVENETLTEEPKNPSKETKQDFIIDCDNINNPFDAVQQLAEVYDPFEVLERQAVVKTEFNTNADVKIANLLSLSDDNVLTETDEEVQKLTDIKANELITEPTDFDNASKNATPSNRCNSSSSNTGSSTEVGSSGKTRKAMEFRKRLLKHRISNSTFNSPLSGSSVGEQKGQACLSSIADCSFSENSPLRKLLSAESPISLVDDEQPSWVDSEKDFEAELEALNIPILQQLPTSNVSGEKLGTEQDAVKKQASLLLDSLSSPVKRQRCTETQQQEEQKQPIAADEPVRPPTIVREGTFDLDLKSNEPEVEEPAQNIPDIMVASSATYDGEPAEERQHDFELPVVEPVEEPVTPPNPAPKIQMNAVQTTPYFDVNNLVEQLGRLWEQHQQDNAAVEGNSAHSNASNPTFILVMNPTQPNNLPTADQCVEDSSSDSVETNRSMRRRSQSLSLPDKITVVQIPVPTVTPAQQKAAVDTYAADTPARRRNSFSFTTPTRFPRGTQTSGTRPSPVLPQRKSLAPENLTRANYSQASVPKPMPKLQLNNIKPDLNKKRQRTSSGSIMKSTGPMKATLSVKNMLTSSAASMLPATPKGRNIKALNDSSQTLKGGRTSHLQTPTMAQSMRHSLAPLNEDSLAPNACSTPAPFRQRTSSAGSSTLSARHSTSFTTPKTESSKPPVFAPSGIASIRRRTVSELSAGSPTKLPAKPSASKIVKPINKTGTSSSTFRPPTRLRFNQPAGPQKSKENKKP